MDNETEFPSSERLIDLLAAQAEEDAVEYVETLATVSTEDRKAVLQALRQFADEQPRSVEPVLDALTPFLTDEERSIRLTTAKLFVAVAEANPDAVVPAVDSLASRLADEVEFYYVRARSAEALGYVALDYPEEVASPETLADLRIGLSFDEPEVKEKLAKALEFVALGNPDRLRHQVANLADHLDNENELVRYHLTTALVIGGCEYPGKLTDAREGLAARLEDDEENPYVRGRAAEALGLLARANTDDVPSTEDNLPSEDDIEESFAVKRVRFARHVLCGGGIKQDDI